MKFLNTLLLLGVFSLGSNVAGQLLDTIDSLQTIITGLGQQIPNLLPTPSEILRLPPQILFGVPEVAFLTIVDRLCTIYLGSDTIQPNVTPSSDDMSLRFHPPSCNESSVSLSQAEKIFENPEFDIDKKVVIFINGWLTGSVVEFSLNMSNAFNCRGDYNFLTLNTSDAINTLYTWSSYNTQEIGEKLALALEKLVEKIPVESIHLIGLSLGANIAGYAARYFNKNTGLNITRITGLDPANPCFSEGETLTGLQSGDAKFVDIIHTNPGAAGNADTIGDVDFYPGGLAPIKPGCSILGCSHVRSFEYFTESVYPGNENNFLGVRCTSLRNVNNGFCNGAKFPMGLATPHYLRGNYFLDVNAEPPYGQNNDGRDPIPSQCNICKVKEDET